MKRTPGRRSLAVIIGWVAAAAAAELFVTASAVGAPAAAPPPALTQPKFSDTIAACRSRFEQVDAQVDRAGVRDLGYHRVPGYPYMRSDRLVASFGPELEKMDALSDWLYQLRDNDGFSRDIELQNLGLSVSERITLLSELRLCGVWLSNLELSETAERERLVALTRVPPERVKAPAPTPDPNLQQELRRRAELVRASYAVPAADLDAPGPLVLWKVKPYALGGIAPAEGFAGVLRDGLGRVGLTEDQWELLANRFAPSFLIETGGKLDRLGTPSFGQQGPFVDVSRPIVDFQADYARLHAQSLVQFNYFIWFPGRAANGAGSPNRGPLDGLIWRVTLDLEGRPLVYDTIPASGFDHLWFPLQALRMRSPATGDADLLVPQPEVPAEFVVRLRSGGHEVRRLIGASEVRASEVREFELRRYEKLLTLPLPGGGTRSLFGPDGTVVGTDAGADTGLSASGVPRAGSIRQWGHHPVSLLGDIYFDDPRLLERQLRPAASPEPRRGAIGGHLSGG